MRGWIQEIHCQSTSFRAAKRQQTFQNCAAKISIISCGNTCKCNTEWKVFCNNLYEKKNSYPHLIYHNTGKIKQIDILLKKMKFTLIHFKASFSHNNHRRVNFFFFVKLIFFIWRPCLLFTRETREGQKCLKLLYPSSEPLYFWQKFLSV